MVDQFVVRKVKRGRFGDNYQVIRFKYPVLIESDDFPERPSDSIALNGLPQPLAGHNAYLTPATLTGTGIYSEIPVCFPMSGLVNPLEFVWFL